MRRTRQFAGGMLVLWLSALPLAGQESRATHTRPRRDAGPPKVGAMAPDFELRSEKAGATAASVKLSSFRKQKPVALIFGSYT